MALDTFLTSLLIFTASAYASWRVWPMPAQCRLYWLLPFVLFAFVGVAGFVAALAPNHFNLISSQMVMASLILCPPAILLGAVAGLLRPIPEKWSTGVMAIAALVYMATVFGGEPSYFIVVTGPCLVGLLALPIGRYAQNPPMARWVMIGGGLIMVGMLVLISASSSLAGGAGLSRMDVYRIALAGAALALAEAARRDGSLGSG